MQRTSWFFVLLTFVIVGGTACTAGMTGSPGPEPEPDPAGFSRHEMLVNVTDNVLLADMRAFRDRADALVGAVTALEAAVTTTPTGGDAEKASAQQAFRDAMDAWQRVEAMPLGPVADPDATSNPDGLALRDEVYSWPLVNTCGVDQVTAAEGYTAAGYPENELHPRYGLDALEYLLFAPSWENSCSPAAPMNADGTWAALGEGGVAQRRAAYGRALAAHAAAQAATLLDAWEREGGYRAKLVLDDTSLFPDELAALDALFGAMFYVDHNVKDMKLGTPAGITDDCSAATCPDKVELRTSKLGAAAVLANLRAIKDVFTGLEGPGFDDYLVAVEAPELAAAMSASLDDAIVRVEAIPAGDLESALGSEPARVQEAHDAVKTFTDAFKSQFQSVLGLSPPANGPVDND